MLPKIKLQEFRRIFEEERERLIFQEGILSEEFELPEGASDEADKASHDLEQSMRLRLRNREVLYLKKIDEAIRMIDLGTFGECQSCGCEIEEKRLIARPTANLCIECKEEQEKNESSRVSGLRSKSLGKEFRYSMSS